ncbi:PAS domain-containing protein [Azospirillum sp. RWY-5-1]|uniref:histidine kinase n=1 Tax=Azospirillum oleiclasticum TaxID=2735135 RepID=A0ABX2TD94_9PROT|nr:ATP-binding protein [Azospirillum oleiclasticum]NYZ14843.1 PAS domain-containing protein [Azospirillum oleiclasticum]NYZ22171.1 PAS domain-containing protein [Azospirillum oleiclasticum]
MLDIRKLFALFVLAAMPIFAFEIQGKIRLRDDRRQEIEAEASRLLNLIDIEAQRTFDGIRQILATLVRTDVPNLAPERCRDILNRLKKDYSEHLAVAFVDDHGVMRCASAPALLGMQANAFPSPGEATAADSFAIGALVVSPATGRPALTFSLTFRNAEGTRVGEAVAVLDTAWLEHLIALLPWPDNAAIMLTDRNRVVLARLPERPGVVGAPVATSCHHLLDAEGPGVARIVGIDGTPRILAYSPIKSGTSGTYTGVAVAVDDGMDGVDDAVMRSMVAFSVILLLCAGGAACAVRKYCRVREQANATQRKMADVLSTITDAVAEVDRDWRITYANARALALVPDGVELAGTLLWGHVPEVSDTAVRELCQRAMDEHKTIEFEFFGRCTGQWYLVRGFPSREGMTFYLKDVTERKGAEAAVRHSAEQLRLAVSAADAGTFDVDLRTGEGSASPDACLMHGLSPADAGSFAREWQRHLHPDDRDAAMTEHDRVIAEACAHFIREYRVVHGDGRTHWISTRGSVLRQVDGSPQRVVGITLDVTGRRQREEALQAAMKRAEQASQAKARFIAVASHDLRQPLQSLFFFMEVLRSQNVDERTERCMAVIESNLTTLRELLDGLLDLSRLDAGGVEVHINSFALDGLLTEIATAYTPVVRGKGLEFRALLHGDATVRSDRVLVGRMVRNLIENAIRYTSEGNVTLSSHQIPAGVEIRVTDTGIGIPADQLDLIFEEFHQVDTAGRRRGQGLGLGLSIVQRLSGMLDHPVSVSSEVAVGTTFTILIPSVAMIGDPAHPVEDDRLVG